MDFRGRVYPVPPHLTHIGSDMARSLLCFAKGEKLGPHGLDWLKVMKFITIFTRRSFDFMFIRELSSPDTLHQFNWT